MLSSSPVPAFHALQLSIVHQNAKQHTVSCRKSINCVAACSIENAHARYSERMTEKRADSKQSLLKKVSGIRGLRYMGRREPRESKPGKRPQSKTESREALKTYLHLGLFTSHKPNPPRMSPKTSGPKPQLPTPWNLRGIKYPQEGDLQETPWAWTLKPKTKYIYIYIYIYVYIYIYMYICMYIYIYMCIYILIIIIRRRRRRLRIRMRTRIRIRITTIIIIITTMYNNNYSCKNYYDHYYSILFLLQYIYIYIHTYIHTYIHFIYR